MVSICTGQLEPSDGAGDRRIRCLSCFFFVPVSGYVRFPVTDSTRVEPSGFGAIFLPINGGAG
jgi:hypothetical protein